MIIIQFAGDADAVVIIFEIEAFCRAEAEARRPIVRSFQFHHIPVGVGVRLAAVAAVREAEFAAKTRVPFIRRKIEAEHRLIAFLLPRGDRHFDIVRQQEFEFSGGRHFRQILGVVEIRKAVNVIRRAERHVHFQAIRPFQPGIHVAERFAILVDHVRRIPKIAAPPFQGLLAAPKIDFLLDIHVKKQFFYFGIEILRLIGGRRFFAIRRVFM